LQGLQQQQQMNALRTQEFARTREEAQRQTMQRNALARIHADPNVKPGTPEYFSRVAQEAPDLFEGVSARELQRENIAAQRAQREAETEKRTFELGLKKEQVSKETVSKAIADIAGLDDLASIESDIEQKLASGELTADQAAKVRRGLPADDSGVPDWQRRSLISLLDLKDRLAIARDEGKPVVVDGNLVSPTGRVIYKGDKKPVSVAPGAQLVDPETGEVRYSSPNKPMAVSPGGQLVDPVTGQVIFAADAAEARPVSVAPGGQLVDPVTGQVIFAADAAEAKPVSVAPGNQLVNPKTGEVIFAAPAAAARESKTDAQRNYDAAIADKSFTGTFAEYLDQQKETEAEREYRKAKTAGTFKGTFLDWKRETAKAMKIVVQQAPGTKPTDTSLDFLANQYILDNKTISAVPKQLRMAVINRATEIMGGQGVSGKDMASQVVMAGQDTAAAKATIKDFTSGKSALAVRSFNTAIDHLDTMSKLATALQNNDTRAFNTVGNFFAKQTGAAAPANFEAAKAIVGGEVAKALTGANMALKDREEIRDAIIASSSPAQLQGVLNTYKQLLGGQLSSLNIQYETSTGRDDFAAKLSPAAKRELNLIRPQSTAPKTSRTMSAEDKKALDWANSNPKDPRSAKIKARLGVK